MKIKGVVEDSKFLKKLKKKSDHKHISRTFSGVVVGIVGVSSF